MQQEQQKLKKVLTKDLPSLKREEAALAAARADVAALSASLERMRIRSPINSAILELNAKVGEMAGLAAESPLLTLGDSQHLQVRAEVEERDISKIYQGQSAVVKSDAFPDRTFDVRVSTIAEALGAPRLHRGTSASRRTSMSSRLCWTLRKAFRCCRGWGRCVRAAQKSTSAGTQ